MINSRNHYQNTIKYQSDSLGNSLKLESQKSILKLFITVINNFIK